MASHIRSGSTGSRFFTDDDANEQKRLINTAQYGWCDGELYFCPISERHRSRQLYLQSYKFTREEPLVEKLKTSLRKLKEHTLVMMVCSYKPVMVRKIKKKLRITQHCLKTGACTFPLHLSKCLQVPS
ncbi:hypothetical protein KP509_38G049300 [Ceratopteris richardii]|uniref:Uncharacterized protein n=1 Tax=Ceratopteris richardii TaxID=49495 RepID=A0A8T2Q4R3_CERRI|nr:hypothetical protein KP509_38G049300 [Ceratopteris richardii]